MRKSFASVLQSSLDSTCHQFVAKEPYLHHGEPALVISSDEEASLAEPFKFTLVGKFSHSKPKMVDSFISETTLVYYGLPLCVYLSGLVISILMLRLLLPLYGYLFLYCLFNYVQRNFYLLYLKLWGMPLRIDEATADLLRPSEVRVCVDVNLEYKLPDRIRIDRGASRSFW
ncbi:Uncharacterized protein Adt_14426 [Abeliophyllum distichum]|uniref:Uncharacterized protein n=1 Tax=Abeliophyllum distichum TaxID=126358 RepID=A0ABD1TZN4_9LAMI